MAVKICLGTSDYIIKNYDHYAKQLGVSRSYLMNYALNEFLNSLYKQRIPKIEIKSQVNNEN